MEIIDTQQCAVCNKEQAISFKFCTACGARNIQLIKKEIRKNNKNDWHIKQLGAYSILVIVLILIATLPDDSFELLLIWTVIAAVFDFIFALQDSSVWRLFLFKKSHLIPLLSIVLICIVSGFVVSYGMDHLNVYLFGYSSGMMSSFNELEYPLLLALLIMAVAPAFFEELAFRGFVFNHLKALGGINAAIFGSAFLFGLVHFSLLSLIWLIPFGLLLSYFRNKYDTLLLGMVGHFTHNSVVILIEYFEIF